MKNIKINLKRIKKQVEKEIKEVKDLKGLDELFNKYLGKKGKISLIFRFLKKLPKAKRIQIGKEANEIKNFLKRLLEEKIKEIKEKMKEVTQERDWFDITVPGKKPPIGHLHPLTLTKRKAEEIFQSMGFSLVEGPEIENEWYNFDALNIPKNHPARDLWDTFWLRSNQKSQIKGGKLLLRTHTSPVQVRYMEKNNPPLRIIASGKVFRHEATDASHDLEFWHLEGLMVGRDISVANFKAIIEKFFQEFFRKQIKIRLRPSYFPFVEPGFEVDIFCIVCGGKGCSVCKRSGWVEIMGAGMVHPQVFKNSGLNPKEWQGFAFGIGLDRLAVMKYKINDIRLFRSGDLRFLEQF